MRRSIPALLLALLLLGITPAQAGRTIDMARFTCSEITSEEEAVLMIFWLDGHLSGQKGRSRVSEEWLANLAQRVAKACAADPDQTLLQVLRRLR